MYNMSIEIKKLNHQLNSKVITLKEGIKNDDIEESIESKYKK